MSAPKVQVEVLMNALVEFAEKMLNTHGEFHPFGGYVSEKDEVVHVGLSPEGHWTSDQHRADALVESLRSLAKEKPPLAFGIVTNVSLAGDAERSDAIRVSLEHRSGYCADVFFHYTLAHDRGANITHVTAQQGIPHLFS
jgi:hypothetical protein